MPQKRNVVYVVTTAMEGGYLPYSCAYFATKRAALQDMRCQAAAARDNGDKVSGSARNGWYVLDCGGSLNDYLSLDSSSLSDLGVDSYDDLQQLNENG